MLKSEEDISARWLEYFSDLLEAGEQSEEVSKPPETDQAKEEIQLEEIMEALKKLKMGKTPGYDGLKPELLKYMGEDEVLLLRRILNKAWKTKEIPEDWRLAVILPIHKKGDTMICENYRGISLMSVAGKIRKRILEKRLRERLETSLLENHAGFRPGRCRYT